MSVHKTLLCGLLLFMALLEMKLNANTAYSRRAGHWTRHRRLF